MLGKLLLIFSAAALSTALALALLWSFQGDPAFAQVVEKKNCPAGFHWERFPSPVGCVQDSLPAHGKIGFDGWSICEEGYVGDSERRPTTDGKQAPGSPYTSFPYLLGCFTREEYAKLEAAGELPSQTTAETGGTAAITGGGLSRASRTLYSGGGGPSWRDLGVAGVGGGALMATFMAAAAIAAGSPPGPGPQAPAAPELARNARIKELTGRVAELDSDLAKAETELERARADREALWQKRKAMEAAAKRVDWQLAGLKNQVARFDANIKIAGITSWAWRISGGLIAVAAGVYMLAAVSATAAMAPGSFLAQQKVFEAALIKFTSTVYILTAGAMSWASGSIEAERWGALKIAYGEIKTRASALRVKADWAIQDVQTKYDEAVTHADKASIRVEDLGAERARVAQQLEAAGAGR